MTLMLAVSYMALTDLPGLLNNLMNFCSSSPKIGQIPVQSCAESQIAGHSVDMTLEMCSKRCAQSENYDTTFPIR